MENFAPYHCTAERHLARLKGNGASLTSTIYNFAFHLCWDPKSKSMSQFWCSIPRLAAYFEADEKTVRKAIRLLEKSGFFELVNAPDGKARRYKVVTHKDWQSYRAGAKSCIQKGLCVEKDPKPWDDEEKDPLWIALYKISGSDFEPHKGFLKGMRNTGLRDEEIASHFEDFLDQNEIANWQRGVTKLFMEYLREHSDLDDEPVPTPMPEPPKRIVTSGPATLLPKASAPEPAKKNPFIEEPDLSALEQYFDKD